MDRKTKSCNSMFKSLLDREGKTRYWLVKQMGTDYATVNKICDNASKSVRIDTLERLMKALDCEVQDLFTEE
ncbi:helix-turn-helix transcriptional regulator [Ruthenibacterium lactatiformans]|uniref:helix-turn-helix domain-containing protein n=1 Tax=Ruthenibacterium lactatiformans TaxID=1550024 RepID=UPI00249508D1|nr:helix-turn-helix transcriptional regulator [Ruthenibacterium lactatiformans]